MSRVPLVEKCNDTSDFIWKQKKNVQGRLPDVITLVIFFNSGLI